MVDCKNLSLNIAFFGETKYPAHNIKWINHLAQNSKHNFIVFTFKNEDYSYIDEKVKVYDVVEHIPNLNFKKNKTQKYIISEILDRHNIHLLHFLWGVGICMWGPYLNRKYIITTRGSDVLQRVNFDYIPKINLKSLIYRNGRNLVFKKHLLKRTYLNAEILTSTSFKQKNTIEKFLKKKLPIQIIRTGVNIKQFKPIENRSDNEKTIIFSPRSMTPLYNQKTIIEAFEKFSKKCPNSHLRMINNRPDTEYSLQIRDYIVKRNLKNKITLLPELTNEEMNLEYNNADLVVMIPQTDGTPVSALESMLCGTPTLLGAYDYDDDLFNEDYIFQLKKNTAEDLYEKMILIKSLPMESLSQKCSRAQIHIKQKSNRSIEMGKIINLYDSISNDF